MIAGLRAWLQWPGKTAAGSTPWSTLCSTVWSLALACMLAVTLLHGPAASAFAPPEAAAIRVAELPPEARSVLATIRAGGPFPYRRDGIVFGNRERLLPPRERGWYTEYTVPTPGARDRGARRLVVGGEPRALREVWYTADHYASFRRVVDAGSQPPESRGDGRAPARTERSDRSDRADRMEKANAR